MVHRWRCSTWRDVRARSGSRLELGSDRCVPFASLNLQQYCICYQRNKTRGSLVVAYCDYTILLLRPVIDHPFFRLYAGMWFVNDRHLWHRGVCIKLIIAAWYKSASFDHTYHRGRVRACLALFTMDSQHRDVSSRRSVCMICTKSIQHVPADLPGTVCFGH